MQAPLNGGNCRPKFHLPHYPHPAAGYQSIAGPIQETCLREVCHLEVRWSDIIAEVTP